MLPYEEYNEVAPAYRLAGRRAIGDSRNEPRVANGRSEDKD